MKNLLDTIELEAERMSKDLVELYASIQSKLSEMTIYTGQSVDAQLKTVDQLAIEVNCSISKASTLIQTIHDVEMDMGSVQELYDQVQQIKKSLDYLEELHRTTPLH
ncbi:hypothetical protein BC833DRAFT_616976 [Globomyces pollinis-pini]|nr:hypothetical protein BC833DRAFT_616976 [Globomyces pollinis-pini]